MHLKQSGGCVLYPAPVVLCLYEAARKGAHFRFHVSPYSPEPRLRIIAHQLHASNSNRSHKIILSRLSTDMHTHTHSSCSEFT